MSKTDRQLLKALEGSTILFGAIKQLKGNINSNTSGQIGRNIRWMHDYFPVSVSKKSESVANVFGLSFMDVTYNKSYAIAKKIKGYTFGREHIEGGVQHIAEYLISNYKEFKTPEDVLNWLLENTHIVVRLSTESVEIAKESKIHDIKELIMSTPSNV